jgi:parallel beta-helix repeat protein
MLNGITLSGFGIEGATAAAGIQVYTSEKCRVLDNVIKNNYHGIIIKHGSRNHFEGNTVSGNKIHGFYVASSRSNTFTGNFAESNGNPGRGYGFYLYFSDRCVLDNNTSSGNNGCGICLHEANDNVIKNNLIESNANFGIRLSKSSNTTLTGNVLSGNETNFDVLGETLAHYTHHVSESNTSDGEPIHYEVIVPVDMAEGGSGEEQASERNTVSGKKSIGRGAGLLIASSKAISRRKGGVITFSLKGGSANRTKRYLILGSLSGTNPGIPLPGEKAVLPLRWDGFTSFIITFMNTKAFSGFMGELDSRGNASAVFRTMGPLPPDMVGLAFTFAYALHDQGWNFVSYPVNIRIKP